MSAAAFCHSYPLMARAYLESARANLHGKLLVANAVGRLLPEFASGSIRCRCYQLAGFQIDDSAFIMGNIDLNSGLPGFYEKLIVGPDVVIGTHVSINLDAEVRIDANVAIGPHVLIYTGTHPIGPGSSRRLGSVLAKPVTIEQGAWVGLGAMILPGITIGHGSIIAAGAVVSTDVPPDSYVEGNPAQVKRQLPWGDR